MILGSILRDILEAEKKARESALEAERYKSEAIAEIEKEAAELIDAKMREAEEKVNTLRAEHRKAAEASMGSAEEDGRAVSERLKKLEKEKSAEWIETVFGRVISDKA